MKYARGRNAINDCDKQVKRYEMTRQEYDKAFPFSNSRKADTIEELCDLLVVIKKNETPKIATLDKLQELQELKEELEDRVNIYGSIWTDKGLIYVAKMNEKGELKLL